MLTKQLKPKAFTLTTLDKYMALVTCPCQWYQVTGFCQFALVHMVSSDDYNPIRIKILISKVSKPVINKTNRPQ
jgi:hypothetical protein